MDITHLMLTSKFYFYLVCECDPKGTKESYINKCSFTGRCTCKKGFTGKKCAGK